MDINTEKGNNKIGVCTCKACKKVKGMKNRKVVRFYKRLFNKRMRRMEGKYINHFWA